MAARFLRLGSDGKALVAKHWQLCSGNPVRVARLGLPGWGQVSAGPDVSGPHIARRSYWLREEALCLKSRVAGGDMKLQSSHGVVHQD